MIKRLLLTLALLWPALAGAEEYLSQDDFLAQAFGAGVPKISTLWLKPEDKAVAEGIFGHPYQGMRVRYWLAGATTAWVLEEIGKERPIRIGVVVDGAHIRQVSILAFEESRGWEVRYPFFTAQFAGAAATADQRLDKSVDGITGATLSVRAVTGVARFALYLNQRVNPLSERTTTAQSDASRP
ncbi:FMN-binding protein [Thalassolituus sp. LLYu03]|uniref:FMN-binding protein n=1 Tax=Thalassolituus sp. LLYu03 TaxID=3421656 RepID=UPI003D294DA4